MSDIYMNNLGDNNKDGSNNSKNIEFGPDQPILDESIDEDKIPEQPVGKTSKIDDKWLKQNGIDAHTVKGDAPGKVSNFDIYVDRAKNLWRVRKGQNPDQGEYLGNLKDFQ